MGVPMHIRNSVKQTAYKRKKNKKSDFLQRSKATHNLHMF